MTNHYTRQGQERLLVDLMVTANSDIYYSKINNLSDYQLMLKINEYLAKLDLVTYTEEELEMELN